MGPRSKREKEEGPTTHLPPPARLPDAQVNTGQVCCPDPIFTYCALAFYPDSKAAPGTVEVRGSSYAGFPWKTSVPMLV